MTTDQLRRAAKILLDNREYTMVQEYVEQQLAIALENGALDDARDNLQRLRVHKETRQLIENLAHGDTT